MKTPQEIRSSWTDDQLKPYLGQWVFFSADGSRILASAIELSQAYDRLAAAGHKPDDTVLDHLILADEVESGICETQST